MLIQSFFKKIVKLSVLFFLLSIHLLIGGYLAQHLHHSEKMIPQSPIPIKINFVTLPRQKIVRTKQLNIEKSPKKSVEQKTNVQKTVPLKSKPVTEKIRQKSTPVTPIVKRSTVTVVKHSAITKEKTTKSKTVRGKTVSVTQSSTERKQIPVSTPVSTPPPPVVSVPAENFPKQAVAPQSIRKTESPQPRESGETKNPSYQGNPLKPPYPSLSRKRGEEGTVHLRVTVSPNGRPSAVTVVKSSGYSRLDNAATSHVQQWRFSPAQKNGRAVSGTVIVPISFRLN